MGLALDTSAVIAAERRAEPVSLLLRRVSAEAGEEQLLLPVVVLMELEHAIHRAISASVAERRQAFIADLLEAVPVPPFTVEFARAAGRIDAQARQMGRTIPTADLMIGTTALVSGYGVATGNLRQYRMIPGLRVVEL